MAFGVTYDFNRKYPIRITTAANLTKKEWFQEAVQKEHIDLFVLIGHNPLKNLTDNISTINILLNYIQGARPNIPVQVFGGHSHIRYWKIIDSLILTILWQILQRLYSL